MKASVLVLMVLGCASFVVACEETDPSPTGGAGGEGGSETGSSSSGGMAGMGGAGGTGGAGGSGGAGGGPMMMLSAQNLGTACNPQMPCPVMGEICVTFMAGAPGFCTIPCAGPMDTMTCSAANGFMGPGLGACAISAQDQMGNMTPVCGVLCGVLNNNNEMCPGSLTCQDKLNGMMPGMDGMNDFCFP